MITYTETNGDSNYRFVQKGIYPQIKRIDNVKGRSNAYAKVFQETDADYVYIIPGDHNVNSDFKFEEPVDDNIHVWPSVNRANQILSYGSSIILFPVAPFKNHTFDKVNVLLGINHPISLEATPASTDQWDYSDFSMFSHIVRRNIMLRMMIEENIAGAREEFDRWQDWNSYPPFSGDNIKTFWEFANTLDIADISDDLFDSYDILKKMFVESFIKTEVDAR